MKRRMGFVSNSSSSSFVIGIKGESLTEDSLMGALCEHSASSRLNKAIVKFIIENKQEETEKSILWNYGYSTLKEAIAANVEAAKLIQDGYKIYSLDASYNDGDYIEQLIGNGEAFDDIETSSFVMKCQY